MTVPTEAVLTALGVVITAVLSWLGVRVKATADEKTAQIAARSPEWSTFVQEVKATAAETEKRLQEQIDAQNTKIGRQDEKIGRLYDLLSSLQRRYDFALDAIRRFRTHHPDTIVQVHRDVEADL